MTAPVLNLRDINFDPRANEHGDLAQQFRAFCDQSIRYWRNVALLRRNDSESFAVVVKVLDTDANLASLVDDPAALFDFAFVEGDESQRYAANALRKMRAAARTGKDTAELNDDSFENVVDGSTDSRDKLPWGEFPYGGARWYVRGNVCVLVGVSGFTQEEDHFLAGVVGEFCALKLTGHDEAAAAAPSEE